MRIIEPAVAEEIRRLASQGVSRRTLAARFDVSRGTVNNIVAGRWRPRRCTVKRQGRASANGKTKRIRSPSKVPVYRCPTCKEKTDTDPCWLCYVRTLKDAERQ